MRIIGVSNKAFDAGEPAKLVLRTALDDGTEFIPVWVKMAVALALGIGPMVGWKRIVVIVSEEICKTHLSYAQGVLAEIVANGDD